MANNTDPLSGELAAPTSYQRPVATKGAEADVFGQAARFVNQLNGVLSSGREPNGPSATEQANLRVKAGMDEAGVAINEMKTGNLSKMSPHGFGVSVLEGLGASDQATLATLKRLQDSKEEGGIDKTFAEVQTELLVTGLLSKHPDIGEELMGEGLSKLGIDHAYARSWKASQDFANLATQTTLDAAKSYADLAIKYGLGTAQTPFSKLVEDGQKAAFHDRNIALAKEERAIQDAANAADAAGLKADAERNAAREQEIDDRLVEARLGQAGIGQASVISMFYNNKFVGADDAGVTKAISESIDIAIARLHDTRKTVLASLVADGVKGEGIKRAETWFDSAQTHLEDIRSGSGSNYNMQSANLKMLNDIGGAVAQNSVPILTTMNSMFGKEMVTNILMGTFPGFPPEASKGLRDELLAAFGKAQGDQAQLNKAALDFKLALSGVNIPSEADPKKRLQMAERAGMGLMATTAALAKPGAGTAVSKQTIDTFMNTSISLSGAVLEEGTILGDQAAAVAADLMFSPKWRSALFQAARVADPEQIEMNVRYNGVAAGAALDVMTKQFVNRGMVEYDKSTGLYKAIKDFTLHPALPGSYPKSVAAANTMNKILNHLVALDTLVGGVKLVPDSALTSKDSMGKEVKMSIKDVFATSDGLQNSLLNWGNNQKPKEDQTAIAKAMATLAAYNKGEGLVEPNYSAITRENVALNLDMAEVDANVSKYTGPNYVPVNSLQEYKSQMRGTESGNKLDIGAHDSSRSSAYGMYGFLKGTWTGIVKSIPGNENLTDDQAMALQTNRAVAEKVMDIFTIRNVRSLRENLGRDVSWDEVNMAHLLGAAKEEGASGFIEALSKNPNMKTKDFFKKLNKEGEVAVIAANPELTGNGEGTLLQMWNLRLKRQDPDWDAYMREWHGVAGAQIPKTDFFGDADIETTGAN